MRQLKWLGLSIFAYTTGLILVGSYQADFFDAALSMLSQSYSQMGLIPYRNFGMVYPPGLFLLFGKFLQIDSLMVTQWVSAAICLPLLYVGCRWLVELVRPDKLRPELIGLIAYILANFVRLMGFKGTLPIVLVVVLFTAILKIRKGGKSWILRFVGATFALLPWIRWEWGLMLIILQLAVGVIDKRTRASLLYSSIGYTAGLLSLAYYLESQGTLALAYDYIVRMPLYLTASYRFLPLPFSLSPRSPEMMIYPLFLLVGWLIVNVVKKRKWNANNILSLGFVGMFLPYALGRSDYGHFLPLWLSVGLAYQLIKPSWRVKWGRALLALTVLPTIPWFLHNSNYLVPKVGQAEQVISQEIKNCKEVAAYLSPGSVFVGRLNYDQYLFNIATLYLTHPHLPPATRFIAEEPGIQSSCEYGSVAKGQLERAPRPILMYLELDDHPPENKATAQMKSCGMIESYLTSHGHEIIGKCSSYGHPFEVRLYY